MCHDVGKHRLRRYLSEFDFRYTTRKLSDTARMDALLGRCTGSRLTYKRVTQ